MNKDFEKLHKKTNLILPIVNKKGEATLFKHLEQFAEEAGASKDELQKVYKAIIRPRVERQED